MCDLKATQMNGLCSLIRNILSEFELGHNTAETTPPQKTKKPTTNKQTFVEQKVKAQLIKVD